MMEVSEINLRKEAPLKGLRILLVDDDEGARDVFSYMLKAFGAEVKTAESVSETLEVFEKFCPDILVSDIAMPLEDGYSLIGKVRAMKSKLSQIPALALTAYASQEDVDRAYAAGFQAHLAKPVEANKLSAAIARIASIKKRQINSL